MCRLLSCVEVEDLAHTVGVNKAARLDVRPSLCIQPSSARPLGRLILGMASSLRARCKPQASCSVCYAAGMCQPRAITLLSFRFP